MKNSQKGFIVPLLIAIVAMLAVGGGVYVYTQNQPKSAEKNVDVTTNNPVATTATVQKDQSACDKLTDNFAKEQCYNNLARSTQNVSLCRKEEKVADLQDTEALCYNDIAVQTTNTSLCRDGFHVDKNGCLDRIETAKVAATGIPANCANMNVIGTSFKLQYTQECYSAIWTKFKDANSCQTIPATPSGNQGAMSSETERDLCYGYFADVKLDESLCKNIGFPWGAQVCLQKINSTKNLQKRDADSAKVYEGIPKKMDQNSCSVLAKRIFDASNPASNGFTTFTNKIYFNNGNCYLLTHGQGPRKSQDLLMSVSGDTPGSKYVADCESYTVTPSGSFCQYFVSNPSPAAEKYDINKFNNFIKNYQTGLITQGDAGNLSASLSDLAAKNTLNQIGTEAWLLFRVTNSYSSLCANGEVNGSLSLSDTPTAGHVAEVGKYLTSLISDVVSKGGKKPNCFSEATNFCASTQLSNGSWICSNKERWGGDPSMLGTMQCTSATTPCK